MLKRFLPLPALFTALILFMCAPLSAAEKNVTLADFNGTWQMDAENSKPALPEVANKLKNLTGFKLTVNSKANTIRMEWADHQPKTRKVMSAKANGKELSCQLEGYTTRMLMEKISDDVVHVKDRDETLVFTRVK